MHLKTVELGEICDITNGSTPSRANKEYWDFGEVSWFTIEDIRKFGRVITKTQQHITEKALQDTGIRILPVNTVLLCCTASVGEYAITKIPLCTNQQFNGLTLKTKEVLPEFLYYFVSTLKDELLRVSGSATINFVAVSKLKKIKFSYPSISTQQKIVEKLDAVFSEIDKATAATEARLNEYLSLRKAVLVEAFDGQLIRE